MESGSGIFENSQSPLTIHIPSDIQKSSRTDTMKASGFLNEYPCGVCQRPVVTRFGYICKGCRRFFQRNRDLGGVRSTCKHNKQCLIPGTGKEVRKCSPCRYEVCLQAGLGEQAEERRQKYGRKNNVERPKKRSVRHNWDLDPVTGEVVYPQDYHHNADDAIQDQHQRPRIPKVAKQSSLSLPNSSASSNGSSPEYENGVHQQANDNTDNPDNPTNHDIRSRRSYMNVLDSVRRTEQEVRVLYQKQGLDYPDEVADKDADKSNLRPSVLEASRQLFTGLLKGSVSGPQTSQQFVAPAVIPADNAADIVTDNADDNGRDQTDDDESRQLFTGLLKGSVSGPQTSQQFVAPAVIPADNAADIVTDNADENGRNQSEDDESLLFEELGFLNGEQFDAVDGDLGAELQNLENMNPQDLNFTDYDMNQVDHMQPEEHQNQMDDADVMIFGERQNENLNIPMQSPVNQQIDEEDFEIFEEFFGKDSSMSFLKQDLQKPKCQNQDSRQWNSDKELDPWLQEGIESILEQPVEQGQLQRENENQPERRDPDVQKMYLRIPNDDNLNNMEKFVERDALDHQMDGVMSDESQPGTSHDYDCIGDDTYDKPTYSPITEDPIPFVFDKELLPIVTQEQFQRMADFVVYREKKTSISNFLMSMTFFGKSIERILPSLMEHEGFRSLEHSDKLHVFYQGFLAVYLLDMIYAQINQLVHLKSGHSFLNLMTFDSGKVDSKCENFERALRMRNLKLGEQEYRFIRTIVMFDKYPVKEVQRFADRAKAAWKDYEIFMYPIEVLEHAAEFANNFLIYKRTEGHVAKSKCPIAEEVIRNLVHIKGIASL